MAETPMTPVINARRRLNFEMSPDDIQAAEEEEKPELPRRRRRERRLCFETEEEKQAALEEDMKLQQAPRGLSEQPLLLSTSPNVQSGEEEPEPEEGPNLHMLPMQRRGLWCRVVVNPSHLRVPLLRGIAPGEPQLVNQSAEKEEGETYRFKEECCVYRGPELNTPDINYMVSRLFNQLKHKPEGMTVPEALELLHSYPHMLKKFPLPPHLNNEGMLIYYLQRTNFQLLTVGEDSRIRTKAQHRAYFKL